MKLENFFGSEQVLILSETEEKQKIIKKMINRLEELGQIQNSLRYYTQVIHRESLENTGIGHGFAIPHARTDSLDDLKAVFAFIPSGIEYNSFDGQPVRFMILSLFPTSMSTRYLFLISMMANVFKDEERVKILSSAKTPEELHALLSEYTQDYIDNLGSRDNSGADEDHNLSGVPSSDLELLIRLDRLYSIAAENNSSEIKEKIENFKSMIDNRSLTYYERMRKKCRNPFALVEKNACSGCHMTIPPAEMHDVRDRNRLSICTHCGRFLIII